MKNLHQNLIVLFLLIFFGASQMRAQENTIVEGQILDAETGQPVSYVAAEIMSRHIGAAANADGIVKMELNKLMQNDTVTFSALAYYTQRILVKELMEEQPFIVEMERKVYMLPEFTLNAGTKDKVQLGNFVNGNRTSHSVTVAGMMTAVFMDNSDGCDGIIKSVSYAINKRNRFTKSYPRTPFRVRIFAVDSLTGEPGEDLLTEELVVKAKGPGWFTVDVSEYNIKAPKEGYFVAMEWIYSKEKYYYNIIAGGEPQLVYGQSLCIVLGNFKPNTWAKKLGFRWYFDDDINTGLAKSGYTNALINSEIECFK